MTDQTIPRLKQDLVAAMKAAEKTRVATLRAVLAEIKQIEVDERIEVDQARAVAILDKMTKQRRESIAAYEKAQRQDLIDIEAAEIEILQEYLPEALGETELAELIDAAIASSGASSMRDMGQVMGQLKPQIQGRADMAAVSAAIKARLS